MEAGWFVPHLPDLNLRNPLLATYLIQQAIWMTQTFQLDGWRVDTYKYCDPIFLNNLNAALEKEFPIHYFPGRSHGEYRSGGRLFLPK